MKYRSLLTVLVLCCFVPGPVARLSGWLILPKEDVPLRAAHGLSNPRFKRAEHVRLGGVHHPR